MAKPAGLAQGDERWVLGKQPTSVGRQDSGLREARNRGSDGMLSVRTKAGNDRNARGESGALK